MVMSAPGATADSAANAMDAAAGAGHTALVVAAGDSAEDADTAAGDAASESSPAEDRNPPAKKAALADNSALSTAGNMNNLAADNVFKRSVNLNDLAAAAEAGRWPYPCQDVPADLAAPDTDTVLPAESPAAAETAPGAAGAAAACETAAVDQAQPACAAAAAAETAGVLRSLFCAELGGCRPGIEEDDSSVQDTSAPAATTAAGNAVAAGNAAAAAARDHLRVVDLLQIKSDHDELMVIQPSAAAATAAPLLTLLDLAAAAAAAADVRGVHS